MEIRYMGEYYIECFWMFILLSHMHWRIINM